MPFAELLCRAQWARRGKGSSRIPHEPKVASRCRRGDLQSETHEGITRLTPGTVIRPASPQKTKPIGKVLSQNVEKHCGQIVGPRGTSTGTGRRHCPSVIGRLVASPRLIPGNQARSSLSPDWPGALNPPQENGYFELGQKSTGSPPWTTLELLRFSFSSEPEAKGIFVKGIRRPEEVHARLRCFPRHPSARCCSGRPTIFGRSVGDSPKIGVFGSAAT